MGEDRGKNPPRGSTAKSTAKKSTAKAPAKKTTAKPFAKAIVTTPAKKTTAKPLAKAIVTTPAKGKTAKKTTPKKTTAGSKIVETKTKKKKTKHDLRAKQKNERVITDRERAEGESANDRDEALRILADIEVLQVEITRSFYDLGLLLKALAAPRLYVALGHTSFEALLRERRVMSPEQARKLIRVVEELDRKRSLKVGMEKAFGLVRLADATKTPRDSAVSLIDDDAPIGDQRVSTASVREVDKARARAAAASSLLQPTDRERDEAARYAATLRESLRQRGVKATVTLVAGARVRIEADPATLRDLLA